MRSLFFVIGLFLLFSCKKETATIQEDITYWKENIGASPEVPLLPDANVNYYLYVFKRKKGDAIAIRIKGQYGYARYMGFNVYDNTTLSSVNSLIDTRIVPDAGSINPYHSDADPTAANRNYTIQVLPRGVKDSGTYENELFYDDNLEEIAIILRYYIPQNNPKANVPLPEVEAFDMQTGNAVTPPSPLTTSFEGQFADKKETVSNLLHLTDVLEQPKNISFYRFSGAFLYPNKDNYYLFTPITFDKDKVIMLRFKAVSYAKDNTQNDAADVRYFSICTCDADTYTYSTNSDEYLKAADSDGYINIVIAEDLPELRAKAEGLNFIPLSSGLQPRKKGLIIYRHLLTRPGFEGDFGQVPDLASDLLDNILNPENLQAETHVAPYAPIGKKMSKADYLENFGGMEVSY